MKFLHKKWWKVILAVIGGIIPLIFSILLVLNIQDVNHQKQLIYQDINQNLSSNQLTKTNEEKYWNLQKINYINQNFNFENQSYQVDLSNILKTEYIGNEVVIDKIISATNLKQMDYLNYYNNANELELINLTNFIDNIKDNYQYRYTKNNIDTSIWSNINITNPNYYEVNSHTDYALINRDSVYDFSLSPINTLTSKQQARYNLADIMNNIGSATSYENEYYSLYVNDYEQLIDNNDTNQYQIAKQLVVQAKNDQQLIDISTYDFWIDLLMLPQFKNVARMVVEPANLIIYRENDQIKQYQISLNANNANNLLSYGGNISFQGWINTCINANPADDFDYRAVIDNSVLNNIKTINIPWIININDTSYQNNHQISSPDLLASNILYAQKPTGSIDFNWGNKYYKNLTSLTISSPLVNNQLFSIVKMNDIRVADTYTNAITNAGSDNVNEPIFANQFFVAPNLEDFYTNDIKTFFYNFNIITYLPLYRQNNVDFSLASYLKLINTSLIFSPEKQTNDYTFNYQTFINDQTMSFEIEQVNQYLNYLNQNRNLELNVYEYFNNYQNQWVSYDIFNSSSAYRYEFLYGVYHFFEKIILPFSLIPKIIDQTNPLYLTNDYNAGINGTSISRIVDPMSGTIIYNSTMSVNHNQEIYVPYLLTNEAFDLLIKQKLNNAQPIAITFDDWVQAGWTGLSDDLDIIQVLNNNNVELESLMIPNIIAMNLNAVAYLKNFNFDKAIVINCSLIILIVLFLLIELFIICAIFNTSSRYNWVYQQIQDNFIV